MPKNKKKGFYGKGQQHLHDFDSIQGILFTCNSNKEREASREALGLVEEFGEKLEDVIQTEDINELIIEYLTRQKLKQLNNNKKKLENVTTTTTINNEQPSIQIESLPSNNLINNENNNTEQLIITKDNNLTTNIEQPKIEYNNFSPMEWLKYELQMIKEGGKNYEILDTGVSGQIFIRIRKRNISPLDLCKKISKHFKKLLNNGEDIPTRFLFKMYPIFDIFKASEENLKIRLKQLIDLKFKEKWKDSMKRYMVTFKSHHNSSLNKKYVYDLISEIMTLKHFVDLTKPNIEFYIFTIKSKCLLGIFDECDFYNFNFNSFRKNENSTTTNTSSKVEENNNTIVSDNVSMILRKRKVRRIEIDGLQIL
ncbi:hypothetical protein ABK040_010007 [Willaertia magna]